MLNKIIWGVKIVEANQKQHYKQACATKTLISAEAKKLLYQNYFQHAVNYCMSMKIGKVTSWPQLLSEFWLHMPVCNVASAYLGFVPQVFCLALASE